MRCATREETTSRSESDAVGLLTAACILTQWWTPTRYGDYKNEFRWARVVLGRDLALVALFAVLAWPASRFPWPRRTAVPASEGPDLAG